METTSWLVCNERGAEMVEYTIVVAILAVAGLMVFGPGGVLYQALTTGLQTVADIVTNVPGA